MSSSLIFLLLGAAVLAGGTVSLRGSTAISIRSISAAAVAAGYLMFLIGLINHLEAASQRAQLTAALKGYLSVDLLLLDELGYLPIDQRGADLLFQVISQRYEQGAIVLTTNKVYKHWASIFNNDTVVTSAILDRLVHHAETVTIEGPSYRQKDRIEP